MDVTSFLSPLLYHCMGRNSRERRSRTLICVPECGKVWSRACASCGLPTSGRRVQPCSLYAHPKCTTCQKARAFLEERAIPYEFRDIKLDNPQKEELREWQHRSGLPLKRFFNTSGLQYKALGLKDRLPGMDEEEQLDLLAADGMLVKRPHPGGRGLRAGGLQARRMGGTFWKKRRERLTSAEIVIKYCGKCDDGAKRGRQPEARGERCEPSAEAAAQATPERP